MPFNGTGTILSYIVGHGNTSRPRNRGPDIRFRQRERRAAHNGPSLAFLYSYAYCKINYLQKNSSLVGLIVRTVTVETAVRVGVKDFPTVLVARVVGERPMRARRSTGYAKRRQGFAGLFIHGSSFLSVDAMNDRLPQRGLCRGDHQMG
jgi:hypothetical protein